ncbi:MAG: hypothetical protein M1813_008852 [Trichoglossum hirsutum]|nr:MAG: hypothetical protein M1813_008852 [Trichoglossum hirsutum]
MEPMRYKHLLSQPELFQPAENTFFEINEGYESHGKILDEDIDNWVARKGAFDVPEASRNQPCVRLIFARALVQTRTTDAYTITNQLFRAGPVPKLPFSKTAFDKLVRDCKIPLQILEMHYRHCNAGCASKFTTFDEPSGEVGVLGLILMIRLHPSLCSLSALSHDINTGITTGLILQAGDSGTTEIQTMLKHYRSLIGQPLLIPTILLDIGLNNSIDWTIKIKTTLGSIEDHTRQHTFIEVIEDRPDPVGPRDGGIGTLMRLAHGAKIEVAVAQRKIRVILSVLSLLQQLSTDPRYLSTPPLGSAQWSYGMKEWIDHLSSQAEMEATDVSFLVPRAENQISAVSQGTGGNPTLI